MNANMKPSRSRRASAKAAQADLVDTAASARVDVGTPGDVPPAVGEPNSAPTPNALVVPSPVITALALVSEQINAIEAFAAGVAEIERLYGGVIFDVSTTAGMADAKKAREAIRKPRYGLQNLLKEGKAPLNNLKRHMEDKTGTLIDRLAAVETPVDSQIKAEEQRKADEKRAKDEAEERRVAAIQGRIEELRGNAIEAVGKSSKEIAELIATVDGTAIDETFAEFKSAAESAKSMTLTKLRFMHTSAVNAEERERKLAEEREEEARRLQAERDAQLAREREQLAEENRRAEEERVKRETAMEEIQSIPHQLFIAEAGRAPYCKGGDLQSYDWVIQQTEAWPVTEERFGVLAGTAQNVKNDTLTKLRERRADLERRLAHEHEARRQREEQERAAAAERERLAEEARQLEARRLEQERIEREAKEGRAADEADRVRRAKLRERIDAIRVFADGAEILTADHVSERLTQARSFVVDESFAEMRDEAQSVLDAIVLRLVDLHGARVVAEAEAARLADARAELERQQEALRLARETVVPPTDPVEATSSENVPAPAGVTTEAAESDPLPSSLEVTAVISHHYGRSEDWAREVIVAAAAAIGNLSAEDLRP